tara:strand:- start:1847 stop:2248 length:402 start_codon:yes stop_codon:yes gene_type:complete
VSAPALVPELTVTDLATSLVFYRDLLGFSVRYSRLDEGFAFLDRGQASLMLDQMAIGRDWVTGPLAPPFGRGINLQIEVDRLEPLLERLAVAGITLFQPVETRRYQAGAQILTQRQFCVQDPDGYLLRFCAFA